MSVDLHTFLRKRLEDTRKDYVADLMAMTTEQLNTSPGGAARTPYDFTFEVAYVNRRVATRLRGETPEAFPVGWMIAPEDYRVRDRAVADFNESVDQVLAAWDAIATSELGNTFTMASGEEVSMAEMMLLASYHTAYHDAQLNYLQAILGDGEMHWVR